MTIDLPVIVFLHAPFFFSRIISEIQDLETLSRPTIAQFLVNLR